MRRVGTRLLSSLPLLVSSALGGCYAHHTADEELLEIPFPAEAYPDAGANVIADAGGSKCTQTDPIQLLLCQFTSGSGGLGALGGLGGTGSGTTGGSTDLSGLQGLIGQFFGGGTGTTTPGSTGTAGLTDLINQLTGMQNTGTNTGANGLQDLINQLTGMQSTATNTGTQPSLQDVIGQILGGGRDAGAPTAAPTTGVTEAQCANASTFQLYIQCALSGFATPTPNFGGRRDGGAAQPTDAGVKRDAGPLFVF